jgi:hypothetical protein
MSEDAGAAVAWLYEGGSWRLAADLLPPGATMSWRTSHGRAIANPASAAVRKSWPTDPANRRRHTRGNGRRLHLRPVAHGGQTGLPRGHRQRSRNVTGSGTRFAHTPPNRDLYEIDRHLRALARRSR